jgi:hypothetical protein
MQYPRNAYFCALESSQKCGQDPQKNCHSNKIKWNQQQKVVVLRKQANYYELE